MKVAKSETAKLNGVKKIFLITTKLPSFGFFKILLYLLMFLKRYFTTAIRMLTKLTFAARIRIPEDKMGTSEPRVGNAADTPRSPLPQNAMAS